MRISFSTDHWECPSCGAALKKASWREFILKPAVIVAGSVATCENCSGTSEQTAVYSGDYDLIPWDERNDQLVFQKVANKEPWEIDFLNQGIEIPVEPIQPDKMEMAIHTLIREGQTRFPDKDKFAIVGLSASRLQVAIAVSHGIDFFEAGELLLANASVSFDSNGVLVSKDRTGMPASRRWWEFWKKQ
jgi:hypothetical protein